MSTDQELLGSLASSDDASYLLCPENRLIAVNAAFRRFALANGGADLCERWQGQRMFDAISPAPLRTFFVDALAQVRLRGEPWQHVYECSSAQHFRSFQMTAYPAEGQRVVIVHALRFEDPHTRIASPVDDALYEREGLITMCSHCRRVKHLKGRERWDWVPSYLHRQAMTVSHGLCGPCAAFYWGDLQANG